MAPATRLMSPVSQINNFRALSEPVRVQLLCHLAVNGPSDIGQIAEAFPQDRSVISRHLQQLARAGIVEARKESRRRVYSIQGSVLLERMEQVTELVRALVATCCPPGATRGD